MFKNKALATQFSDSRLNSAVDKPKCFDLIFFYFYKTWSTLFYFSKNLFLIAGKTWKTFFSLDKKVN